MFLVFEILLLILLLSILGMLYKSGLFSIKNRLFRALVKEYWDGNERRKYIRFKKTVEITYIIVKNPDLNNNGKTADISEGGMKLVVDKKLSKDDILEIRIALPGGNDTAIIEASVIWSEDAHDFKSDDKRLFYAGIQFSSVKEPSGKSIADCMRPLIADCGQSAPS
jgi:c-di-GMP-binding flagellar brake protein YcgR